MIKKDQETYKKEAEKVLSNRSYNELLDYLVLRNYQIQPNYTKTDLLKIAVKDYITFLSDN